jgi:hypothetical protein
MPAAKIKRQDRKVHASDSTRRPLGGVVVDMSRDSRRRRTLRRRAHFRRVERHDRFAGGQKHSEKVALASAAVL